MPYSSEINDQNIKNQLIKLGVTGVNRLQRPRYLIRDKSGILETHNALSALIAENTTIEVNGKKKVLMDFGQVH